MYQRIKRIIYHDQVEFNLVKLGNKSITYISLIAQQGKVNFMMSLVGKMAFAEI